MPPKKLTLLQLALFMDADCLIKNRSENTEFDSVINPDLLSKYEKKGTLEKITILPKLRPLSDMTDEELDAQRWKRGDIKLVLTIEEIFFMLSRKFDIFGWIENGLALDKTKMKKENE